MHLGAQGRDSALTSKSSEVLGTSKLVFLRGLQALLRASHSQFVSLTMSMRPFMWHSGTAVSRTRDHWRLGSVPLPLGVSAGSAPETNLVLVL